jgi:hypothetical protein
LTYSIDTSALAEATPRFEFPFWWAAIVGDNVGSMSIPRRVRIGPAQIVPVRTDALPARVNGMWHVDDHGGEILVNAKRHRVEQHLSLFHELIHIAEEKLVLGGLIRKRSPERRVEHLATTLFGSSLRPASGEASPGKRRSVSTQSGGLDHARGRSQRETGNPARVGPRDEVAALGSPAEGLWIARERTNPLRHGWRRWPFGLGAAWPGTRVLVAEGPAMGGGGGASERRSRRRLQLIGLRHPFIGLRRPFVCLRRQLVAVGGALHPAAVRRPPETKGREAIDLDPARMAPRSRAREGRL